MFGKKQRKIESLEEDVRLWKKTSDNWESGYETLQEASENLRDTLGKFARELDMSN